MSDYKDICSSIKSHIVEKMFNCEENDKIFNNLEKWFCSREYLKDLEIYKRAQGTEKALDSIVEKLRELLPWQAILPSENINNPVTGPNSDCNSKNTHHMDGFLYEDAEVEKILEEKGIAQRFCKNCGSFEIEDIILISHSLSRQKMQYVFKVLLPQDCSNKNILDVGSRIGAVLYGAYYYTNSPHIFGVELNKDLCEIQNKIINSYNMGDRIKVVNGDVAEQKDIVATSDIVILNNVFEFFIKPEAQVEIWRFLKKTLKKGCILISVPSVEESLDDLEVYEEFSSWVKPLPPSNENSLGYNEESLLSLHEIYSYSVQ